MDSLAFRADALARARGWTDPVIVDVEGLATIEPSGGPVLVVVHGELTTAQAQAVAGVHAAGRPIVVVAEVPLVSAVARWLPDGVEVAAENVDDGDCPIAPADEPGDVPQELVTEVVLAVLARLTDVSNEPHPACSRSAFDLLFDDGSWDVFVNQVHTRKAFLPFMSDENWWDIGWTHPYIQATPEQAALVISLNSEWALGDWSAAHQRSVAAEVLAGFEESFDFCRYSYPTPAQLRIAVRGALARGDMKALAEFASDIRCPPDMLNTLSHHDSSWLRAAVAANISTPREVLLALSRDLEPIVASDGTSNTQAISRLALANPCFGEGTTLPDALRVEAQGRVFHELVQVAGHPDTPADVMELLADRDTPENQVAQALAFNPNTSPALLERLAETHGEALAPVFRARRQRDFGPPPPPPLNPFTGDWDEYVRPNPLLDGDEDEDWYGEASYERRAAQAVNLDLTEDQLLDLAGSRILLFRLAAACHRRTTTRVLTAVVDGLLDDGFVLERACPHT